MALLLTVAVFSQSAGRASASLYQQSYVEAPTSLRQAWMEQNIARNQRLWQQHLGRNRHGINAAATNAMPLNLSQVWARYSRQMRFASQLHPSTATGLLPESSFVNGLWSKRAINNARFTAYHPTIARVMDWNTYFQGTPSPVITPAISTATTKPTTVSPQVVVPEPSSLLIAASIAGAAFWYRRKA